MNVFRSKTEEIINIYFFELFCYRTSFLITYECLKIVNSKQISDVNLIVFLVEVAWV